MKTPKRPKILKLHVTTEVYETFVRLAEIENKSLSAFAAELFQHLLPGLKDTLMMMEKARKLDSQAKKNLVQNLERHEHHLRQAVDYVRENLENDVKQHKLPL